VLDDPSAEGAFVQAQRHTLAERDRVGTSDRVPLLIEHDRIAARQHRQRR
jgi:hypothetical protein